ncbi:MAG: restriction endonuclease subunit S [Novosphingobium sp.]|nr:restriction endonuclease subunit S [Novosphingobium sp.]
MSFVEDLSELVAANAAGVLSVAPHWQRGALGSVASVINGFAFPSKHFKASKGFPLVRIRDVVDGQSDTLYDGPIPDGYWVNDGDLLVGMDGDFNCALWRGGKALLNQRVCKIVPDETRLRKQFLLYVLPGYLKLINDYTSSVTVKHLSSRTLQQLPLPLPELAEQDRLIARIDALFAEIDEGEAALARARAGVETYRKALLKAAVTGELTADWRVANPPEETGEQLLARILADRRARWHADPKNARKKYPEPAGPDTDGLPELPEGWTWANLDQLSTHEVRNGLSVKDTSEPTEVRALRLGALSGNEVDWSVFRYLPRTLASVEGYRLQDGDLLVSRANGSPELVGKASLCVSPPADIIFPDTAIRFRLLGGMDLRQWVVRVWNSLLVRHQIGKLAKTTAGILKISQADISRIALPIPSAGEMVAASRTVQEQLSKAANDDLLRGLGGSASTLRQSILAAAFRGELAA